MKTLALTCCLLFCTVNLLRAEDYELGDRGKVSIKAPEGWTAKGEGTSRPGKGEIGYTVKLDAPEGVNAKALITFLYVKDQKPTKEGAEEFTRRNGQPFLKSSVEEKITPMPFAVKQGFGFYSVFTDSKLVGQPAQMGNCKVMGSGIVQLSSDLLVVVTMLADDAQGKEFKAMIEAVNGLVLKQGAKGPTI